MLFLFYLPVVYRYAYLQLVVQYAFSILSVDNVNSSVQLIWLFMLQLIVVVAGGVYDVTGTLSWRKDFI